MEPPINDTDEKYYYKIGEVAKKIGIEPYVIRYWETEFSFLKPYKSKSSHRLYSRADVERILLVKDYLYNKKFTIEGAKKAIRSKLSDSPDKYGKSGKTENGNAMLLKDVRDELNSIKSLLLSRKTRKSI
ncbi:MAG: MerR family transcriptional regulator [bacterium]